MEAVMEILEMILEHIVEITVLVLEYIGVIILAITTVRGLISALQRSHRTKLVLLEGYSLGISFMMGSEMLRTVSSRTLMDIAIVGGIIVLRASLTFLLVWETKVDKKELEEEEKEKH